MRHHQTGINTSYLFNFKRGINTVRVFAPLPKDHPLVKEKVKCPVCHQEFKERDRVVLVPIQAHGEEGIHDLTVMAIPVHVKCYWPGEKIENLSKRVTYKIKTLK